MLLLRIIIINTNLKKFKKGLSLKLINYILNINNIGEETVLTYQNNDETNTKLAKDADIPNIEFFSSTFTIKKKGKRIHIHLIIDCKHTQLCGVTLEEVSQKINTTSTRNYILSSPKKLQNDIDVNFNQAEDTEYITQETLDLYSILLEEIILNIDYNFKQNGVDILKYSKELRLNNNIKLHIDKIKS